MITKISTAGLNVGHSQYIRLSVLGGLISVGQNQDGIKSVATLLNQSQRLKIHSEENTLKWNPDLFYNFVCPLHMKQWLYLFKYKIVCVCVCV